MSGRDSLAILVAAAVAFVIGGLWYSPLLFGNSYATLRGLDPAALAATRPPVGEMIGEFARVLVVAFVLRYLLARMRVADVWGAAGVGLLVWFGFQAMMLLGAVLHEGMPWRLYAIHASDALVKTGVMSLLLFAIRSRLPKPA